MWLNILFSCSEKSDTATVVPTKEIADLTRWTIEDPSTAPFSEHRPEVVDCPSTAFELEGDQLEVSTDKCNYVAITFPIVQNVPAGTPVKTLVLHTGLWAPEPGFAHVAWIINDTVFWEENPEIPASTEFYFQESELPFAIGPSDTLHFHLHNHGANDWKIAEFQRTDID